jgi:hypothetical protein
MSQSIHDTTHTTNTNINTNTTTNSTTTTTPIKTTATVFVVFMIGPSHIGKTLMCQHIVHDTSLGLTIHQQQRTTAGDTTTTTSTSTSTSTSPSTTTQFINFIHLNVNDIHLQRITYLQQHQQQQQYTEQDNILLHCYHNQEIIPPAITIDLLLHSIAEYVQHGHILFIIDDFPKDRLQLDAW